MDTIESLLPQDFYKKEIYTNKGMAYLFNDTIYEYDMHSAGINLIQYYKLLPPADINTIRRLGKEKGHRKIGILEKHNPELRDGLKKAFAEMRKLFYEANHLEPNDILSVKKDAIFTRRMCEVTKFGNVEFRVKNTYSSFLQLKNLEIYYREGKLDVKGIDDATLELHKEGICKFLMKFLHRAETQDLPSVYSFLVGYSDQYKWRQLPVSHYREFNPSSSYVVLDEKDIYAEYWEEEKQKLNIRYNWENVIIPLYLMLW